ncbi:transposase [Ktedonosporobacter rubrisoli]|uniref:Transposase n=1 Tax=Ktedonosporobacter rubrisoli TaxID=2509675 RepID=A0A4P6JWH4_KTERU|nr:transposase [Ktedonosporobacter rubrisoli]QBD79815.1 transposase [Ktedonosporobacter rubrisoli]
MPIPAELSIQVISHVLLPSHASRVVRAQLADRAKLRYRKRKNLVHHLQGDQLDAWIAKVTASQIKDLQRFAKGLQRDKAAVLVGFTCSYNNGQTEGQVTRIKLIKRMMDGRAGFALLRQHVLHAL